jgi:hypothetical protein
MSEDNKKGWSGWTRDASFFAMGTMFGAAVTFGVGSATEAIRTPEEREAALKASTARDPALGKGG